VTNATAFGHADTRTRWWTNATTLAEALGRAIAGAQQQSPMHVHAACDASC